MAVSNYVQRELTEGAPLGFLETVLNWHNIALYGGQDLPESLHGLWKGGHFVCFLDTKVYRRMRGIMDMRSIQ